MSDRPDELSDWTTPLAIVTIGMAVIVGSALAFEHIVGYVPCALCLEQRTPYYIGIAFGMAGLLAALMALPACVMRGFLAIIACCLSATATMGAYHAGVEWGWFEAPATCGAAVSGTGSGSGNLLADLQSSKPPSCDDAAGRFLGLSFAGWNVIAATALLIYAVRALMAERA